MTIIFGQTPPPPKTHATCKAPRWQWDNGGQKWVCMACYQGNPLVIEYGAGPAGMTCKWCVHRRGITYDKTYWKCEEHPHLTHGAKTDNKAHWPACARFAPIETETTAS